MKKIIVATIAASLLLSSSVIAFTEQPSSGKASGKAGTTAGGDGATGGTTGGTAGGGAAGGVTKMPRTGFGGASD